jgi:pyrroline-5-carboxylate reductase
MAEAIFQRLTRERIIVSDKNTRRLQELKVKYKITLATSNVEAFKEADIVFLSVKPQDMPEVLNELSMIKVAKEEAENKLIISIAAGVPLNYIQSKIPCCQVVRAMPNNPCMVGMGVTALVKGRETSLRMYKNAEVIFRAVGEVYWVPENWIDAVTGLSGSGPAFVYQAVEGLTQGGVEAGLPREIAEKLARQTLCGAAGMISQTEQSVPELTKMVASPGGTTEEGLKVLEEFKFKEALSKAVVAAAQKAKEIGQAWSF